MRSTFAQIAVGVIAALVVSSAVLLARATLLPEDRPTIAPDASASLDRVVLHFDPGAADVVEATYQDILAALPEARFTIAVARREDFDLFRERFAIGETDRRFSPAVVGRPITTWSRDRYTLVRHGDRRLLYVPPQRPQAIGPRANDWLVPFELARHGDDVDVSVLEFDFDGGDMIASEAWVFADVNLIRKNPATFRTPSAVAHTLEELVGKPVFVLGEEPGDVPHHHIGMYLTPLPNGAIAVGSPTLAVDLLGGPDGAALKALQARLDREGLPAIDLSPATTARFDRPAAQLEAAGFRVVRLPLIPLADQVTFITYNNGVFHTPEDRPRFLMPAYDLPTLDQAAADLLAKEGIDARPIDVAAVFRHHGSVRCLVNRL